MAAFCCASAQSPLRSLHNPHCSTLPAAFSPRVESTCPGAIILDLAGMEKLLRTWEKNSWQSAARAMTENAVEIGFDLRVAIAANPDTAFLAARGFSAHGSNILIPAGEEVRRLAALPICVLPISPEMLEVLNSWGIRTFESLAGLPMVGHCRAAWPGRFVSAKTGARTSRSSAADDRARCGVRREF